jgi:hypothetical protein
MHALLQRLSLLAGDVEIGMAADNSPTIHRAREPARIYALAWEGLSFTEAAQALSRLQERP